MTLTLAADNAADASDPPVERKARGAFFTPEPIARFISEWAIRHSTDSVLEPSCGEAAFLVQAVATLQRFGASQPGVDGVEIHGASASEAVRAVEAAGGRPRVIVQDFFEVVAEPHYDAVIGNPPFIRYQDFSGPSRAVSRAAALRAGVNLSALASSWAAFVVHSTQFLRAGGRLGMVVPAELLSVNYASAVRRYLFESFSKVDLVLFEERVFPEAETEVVLLLASGFRHGPTDHAVIHERRNAGDLIALGGSRTWRPTDPSAKWTSSVASLQAEQLVLGASNSGAFSTLQDWGRTRLGMVTGNNAFFAMPLSRVRDLGLRESDLLRLSPPGSSHLRGLELSPARLQELDTSEFATRLFSPRGRPSARALDYIRIGEAAGVDQAYKCRVRSPWWRVPVSDPPDLMLTYMNADTPRLTTNSARAHHLNSVHGVNLVAELRVLGMNLLPLASLNSLTLHAAETSGRAYGGGVLKIEPREAAAWAMPAPALVERVRADLIEVRQPVARALAAGDLNAAVEQVDAVVLERGASMTPADIWELRSSRRNLLGRRVSRSTRGR